MPRPSTITPHGDDDLDQETSRMSRREAPPASARSELGGLADVLEPIVPPPVSVRAPVQVQDFAFADTVSARELEEPAPASGPIFVNDLAGSTQCVTPLAFPLPPASADARLSTRARVLSAHFRHSVRHSVEEMKELWAGTAEIVDGDAPTAAPASPAGRFVRRVLALWSCWQWDRTDLTRAAMIGLGVFVVAAVVGATTMSAGDAADADAASGASEVRATRTLDQHTGRNPVVRAKAVAR
ncbi:MAG: hypothetical protein KF819_18565 [Labilithrix sp.]|nr:hypothetical protein [Labilithrix sp.]